ncbi:MAG: insulinase family protein [Clostridia bacterium]|nr:insulinase family protein [Clostridia bacterium]
MKRNLLIGMLLVLVMLVSFGEAAEIGDTVHGFRLFAINELEMQHSTLYQYEHIKTGAKLCYVANEDTNRAFSIAFNTPVYTDDGLPHVFEHAALGGSDKYPDPNLFFSMVYGTYSTYMNASTASSFTMFPVSSLSEEQLKVDMDVYLSGVFFPLLRSDHHAMMREAYRYELTDPEEDITLEGTVYSEMMGALSHERMAQYYMLRQIFPGSYLGSVTGGTLDAIPDLTYEELLAFHETHYTPSNSLTILYGDLDIDAFLDFIDSEYFSKFERTELDLTDYGKRQMEADVVARYTFPVTADSEEETILYYAFPVNVASVSDSVLLDIAVSILGWTDHVMDRRMTERFPEAIWSDFKYDMRGESYVIGFKAIGIAPEDAEDFRAICEESLADAMKNGFAAEDLQVYVDNMRYQNAVSAETVDGVSFSETMVSFWDTFGSADAYVEYSDVVMHLDEVKVDYLNDLFRTTCENATGHALVMSTAVPGEREKQDQKRAERLKEMKEAMSEEEIKQLIADTEDYASWLERNTQNSLLSEVMAVDVDTLPEEIVRAEVNQETLGKMTVYSSPLEDTDYISNRILLDASGVPAEELLPLHLWLSLVGELETETIPRDSLVRVLEHSVNGFTASLSVIEETDTVPWRPVVTIRWNTFRDMAEESVDTIRELLLGTQVTDLTYIRSMLASDALSYRTSVKSGISHMLGYYNAKQQNSEAYAHYFAHNGLAMAQYEERLVAASDEELAAELERAREALRYVLGEEDTLVTIAGSEESIREMKEYIGNWMQGLEAVKAENPEDVKVPEIPRGNTAIEIETGVSFNLEYLSMKDSGYEYTQAIDVFANLALDQVLTPVLRFENSVYTAIFQITKSDLMLLTYRDPNLSRMYREIFPSLGAKIRGVLETMSEDDLKPYITNTYTNLAMPLGPISRANRALQGIVDNRDYFEETAEGMKVLKALTPEDMMAYSEILDELSEKGLKVTVTSPQMAEEVRDLFEIENTDYMSK